MTCCSYLLKGLSYKGKLQTQLLIITELHNYRNKYRQTDIIVHVKYNFFVTLKISFPFHE
jgi:hypothetical protein